MHEDPTRLMGTEGHGPDGQKPHGICGCWSRAWSR
jgi:hypothetical protein